jgi:hypothetical protein
VVIIKRNLRTKPRNQHRFTMWRTAGNTAPSGDVWRVQFRLNLESVHSRTLANLSEQYSKKSVYNKSLWDSKSPDFLSIAWLYVIRSKCASINRRPSNTNIAITNSMKLGKYQKLFDLINRENFRFDRTHRSTGVRKYRRFHGHEKSSMELHCRANFYIRCKQHHDRCTPSSYWSLGCNFTQYLACQDILDGLQVVIPHDLLT